MRFDSKWVTPLVSAALLACVSLPTPRVEDAPAPRDYFRQASMPKQSCDPPVEVVASPSQARLGYRELASISTRCYPGSPRVCELRLAERACALHADAVILTETSSDSTPLGASQQSEISMHGRAVRWVTK